MRTESEGAAWSWAISLAAFVLLVWAVAEFVRPASMAGVRTVRVAPAAELVAAGSVAGATELHRLLPDATGEIGRAVRVDGTVVGEPSTAGFWVRDLRDHIVFVGTPTPAARPRAGDAVRVRGFVALLPPDEQALRLEAAGLVVPSRAIVIRDVKVVPPEGGVELLVD